MLAMAGVGIAIVESRGKAPPGDKWDAVIERLPTVNGKFLFEGDIQLTRSDLVKLLTERENKSGREVFQRLIQAQGKRGQDWPDVFRDTDQFHIQIRVDLDSNRPDIYPMGKRALTYGVYRADFAPAEYDAVVKAISEACRNWQNACPSCGVSFTHREASDGEEYPGSASFVVRKSDGRNFLAYSFFPNAARRDRTLTVYQGFFDSSWNQAGIMRHELGHILGYVHEFEDEKQVSTKCDWDGRQWRLITPYDSKSVMHFCAGDAGQDTTLALTPEDIRGHRLVYNLSQ
jgi:hypothetical protein